MECLGHTPSPRRAESAAPPAGASSAAGGAPVPAASELVDREWAELPLAVGFESIPELASALDSAARLHAAGKYEAAHKACDAQRHLVRSGHTLGTSTTFFLNLAACALGHASTLTGSAAEPWYVRALDDAGDAFRGAAMIGGAELVRSLYRRALAASCLVRSRVRELGAIVRSNGQTLAHAAKDPSFHACLLKPLELAEEDVDTLHKLSQPGVDVPALADAASRQAVTSLVSAFRAQLAELRGLDAGAAQRLAVAPGAFGPGVVFMPGASWMRNQVALEVDVRRVALPVRLNKQVNNHSQGELAVWALYSDHLGAAVLRERCIALGAGPGDYANQGWTPISTPDRGFSKSGLKREEFILSLDLMVKWPGVAEQLVSRGVIERVRVLGHTDYGEPIAVYRVKF